MNNTLGGIDPKVLRQVADAIEKQAFEQAAAFAAKLDAWQRDQAERASDARLAQPSPQQAMPPYAPYGGAMHQAAQTLRFLALQAEK